MFEKFRQLLQALHPFIGNRQFPGSANQVQRLRMLLPGPLVNHIAHLVIPAALHRLMGAEHFFDARPEPATDSG